MNKKRLKAIIIAAILLIITILILFFVFKSNNKTNNIQFSCNSNSDCISQCRNGCVNKNWALSNPDPTECFRAWECTCVNQYCDKDGMSQFEP